MFAAQQGDADSARILLNAEANPNEVLPKSGATPLIIASAMGNMVSFRCCSTRAPIPTWSMPTVSPPCITPCGMRITESTRRQKPLRCRS